MTETISLYVATGERFAYLTSMRREDFERTDIERHSWQRPDAFQPHPGISAVWHVDVPQGDYLPSRAAIAAVINTAAGVWTPCTVTQLYPRPKDADERLEAARSVLRADYWQDVRDVVDDVKDEIEKRRITTEDEVTEYADERVDGAQRVIYTGQAIECLLFSRHEDAYVDAFGAEGIAEDGTVQWSRLALYAFREDVSDELGDIEALLEDAAPDECEDCGAVLPDEGSNLNTRCAECDERYCEDCGAELPGDHGGDDKKCTDCRDEDNTQNKED